MLAVQHQYRQLSNWRRDVFSHHNANNYFGVKNIQVWLHKLSRFSDNIEANQSNNIPPYFTLPVSLEESLAIKVMTD
jgi:hypothetical protein